MKKSFLEIVGQRLRCYRESRGYKVGVVAKYCHVSGLYLMSIEEGEVKPPYDVYERLCSFYGIDAGAFFGVYHWEWRAVA